MSEQFLIVDDAEAVHVGIEQALLDAGVSEDAIASAKDGKRGLELFSRLQPDLVFMDLNMSRLDGREATVGILRKQPSTKIVIITGRRPGDERVQDVRSAGAFEVLHKPVCSRDVGALLREVRGEQRVRAGSVDRVARALGFVVAVLGVADGVDLALPDLVEEVLDDGLAVLAEPVVDVLEEAERVPGLVDELEAGLLEVAVLDPHAGGAAVDEAAVAEGAADVGLVVEPDLLVDERLVVVFHRAGGGRGPA